MQRPHEISCLSTACNEEDSPEERKEKDKVFSFLLLHGKWVGSSSWGKRRRERGGKNGAVFYVNEKKTATSKKTSSEVEGEAYESQ